MNNTIKIVIPADDSLQQILVAELSSNHFDAFEEKTETLEAFIKEEHFDENALKHLLQPYGVDYKKITVKEENWNALWESNFQPVVVDDFCLVRADFHPPQPGIGYEIIITPKMSFGTGHHATTFMMISQMKDIEFQNKTVADFGTGTGILAILAEKLGAANVWAVDNDDWSIENAAENISRNHCNHIGLARVDSFANGQIFDVILANINRNVILENVDNLTRAMKNGSTLLLSGLLEADENIILQTFNLYNISKVKTLSRNGWISILMK